MTQRCSSENGPPIRQRQRIDAAGRAATASRGRHEDNISCDDTNDDLKMTWPIITLPIDSEGDVVTVRQRARRIAELLGFERQDQTRIATAVSEIARNA